MLGIPLDEQGVYLGGFTGLLRPYPLLLGLLTVAMFAMHGALFLSLKVPPGPLYDRVRPGPLQRVWSRLLGRLLLPKAVGEPRKAVPVELSATDP